MKPSSMTVGLFWDLKFDYVHVQELVTHFAYCGIERVRGMPDVINPGAEIAVTRMCQTCKELKEKKVP